jgi:hypothetical protein
MINFEFLSAPNGANDCEVIECCGTTCNKNLAVSQFVELKDHIADLTAKVALLTLYTRFQAIALNDAPLLDIDDVDEMVQFIKDDAGLDYLSDRQLIHYVNYFRDMYNNGVEDAH